MILKVYEKSDREIEMASYAYDGKPACATFVYIDGRKVNTDDLKEKQILDSVEESIRQVVPERQRDLEINDLFSINNTYPLLEDAKELLGVVRWSYKPSLAGMKRIIGLLKNPHPVIRELANQILVPTAERGKYSELVNIAQHYHKCTTGTEIAAESLTRNDLLLAMEHVEAHAKLVKLTQQYSQMALRDQQKKAADQLKGQD